MSIKLNIIMDFFESIFASINEQAKWDYSGAQIYLGNSDIKKLCLALDPTLDVINQTIENKCQLLITHHPLFLCPSQGVNINNTKDEITIKAIQNNIAILSYHTNLDVSKHNTSTHMADTLNAKIIRRLQTEGEHEYYKFIVFTPSTHTDKIINAISEIGGGIIRDYERCAFISKGTCTFKPTEDASPYSGKADEISTVDEDKLEMIIPAKLCNKAIVAMRAVHPYEEPAFDLIKTSCQDTYGYGAIVEIDKELPYEQFLKFVADKLGNGHVGTNMQSRAGVKKFAVMAGSGVSMWKECIKQEIDILITGDMKHHDAIDAKGAGICILDVGHFNSEKIYMDNLKKTLAERFSIDIYIAKETPSIVHFNV